MSECQSSTAFYVGRECSVRDDGRANPSTYVTCPYDSNHTMPHSRYVYHVRNCRTKFREANPSEMYFKICPWNARHEMPAAEYKQHLIDCTDRCDR